MYEYKIWKIAKYLNYPEMSSISALVSLNSLFKIEPKRKHIAPSNF